MFEEEQGGQTQEGEGRGQGQDRKLRGNREQLRRAREFTVKTSLLWKRETSRGFEKCHHLTSVFKGSLLRIDCKGKSRESNYEAIAVMQVSERGWWQWERGEGGRFWIYF